MLGHFAGLQVAKGFCTVWSPHFLAVIRVEEAVKIYPQNCSSTHRFLCNGVKSGSLEPHRALVGKCPWQDIMKVISGVIKAALYYTVPWGQTVFVS